MPTLSYYAARCLVAGSVQPEAGDAAAPQQHARLAAAAVLLLVLAVCLILLLGFWMIGWAVRLARRARRRGGPEHTVMPDLWFEKHEPAAEDEP